MAVQQIDIVANLLMKVDGAEAGINKLKSSLSKLKMPEGLENSFKKSFANLDTLFAKYKSQVEKGFDTKGDVTAFNKTSKALDAELTRISKHFTELTGKEINFKVKSDDIVRTERELEKLLEQKAQLSKESLKFEIKGGKDGFRDVETLLQKMQTVAGKTKTGESIGNALDFLKTGDVQSAVALLEKASVSVKRFKQEKQDAFKNETGFDMSSVLTTMISMLNGVEGEFGDVNAKITEAKNNLTTFQAKQIQDAGNYAEELSNKMENSASTIRQADGAMQEFARSSQSMSQQLGDLQQSTQYFFSLRNMINLFKRGVDDAIQSVKELDKAMTDTAVVTDYKVSDMWNMLPQYTNIANELGATTQGAYETMTLYFQQGLDQQQAFEIGAETMKMARIAGLDYAETTDMMTAALRGFNMELNETSAKRVNDVYSELAAITASDTEELGTAMQRTASIAHSAGASFEGTTAFLAQAIETTREPAENIGTAMKTIIARFQEMKKNPLEISEVEGEEVDFNKIDAALKTIGVDLVDTNGQFRDFDKVMLEISQKWDTLSQSQQRYIATTAAGSRQQSRFIAMVSDYDRTMQLMEAANNSTGASDEQFGKTMDSLEAKLNKLHNAWQRFTMGIANNGMIKGAVDGVTSLLSGVNNLIDTLSGGIGPIKSFLSIFTAFTGLKAAGKIANGLIGALGGLVDPKTSLFKGMVTGAKGMHQGANAAQAKAISDPIVAVLKQIYGKLNGNQGVEQNLHRGNWQEFKNAQERFKSNANKGTIGDTIRSLRGLDKAQINGILANNPAIENRLQKGINRSIGKMNITEGTQKLVQKAIPGIFTAFKQSPNMSPDAFVKALRPNQIGYALVKSGEKQAGQEIINAYNQQTRKNVEAFMSEHGVKTWEEHTQRMNGQGGEGYRSALKDYLNKTNDINNLPLPEPTKWDKLGASVGAVGSMFGMAGQAATSFGVALSNLGLEKTGNAIASLGTSLSNIGSTIGSVAMTIAAVGNAGGLGALLAPIIPYLPYIGAIIVGIGAISAIALQAAKQTKAIKDSAEQVTKSFEETSKQTKENIATLQQYKSEMARLSQGVDQNGNNVNLSTDDYDEYLKIVDEIAAMNPDIVRGYNAQGHAIIDNNTALQKTLDLQEQINQETTDKYLKQTSLEKLLAARNLRSSDYTKNASFISENATRADKAQAQFMYGDQNYGIHKSSIEKQVIPLQKQAQKVAKELQKSDLFKQDEKSVKSLLQSYGIDFDKLLEGEKESVDNFVKNQSNIQSQLSSAAEGLGVDFSDKFNSAFEDLSIDTDAFNASIEPIFKNLAARVSNNEAFKNIAPEIQTSIMSGLKEIAKQDISASEMISQSNELVTIFQKLGDKTGEYGNAIKLVENEQEKFSDSLDEEAYSKGVQPAIDKLYELRDAAADLHTTAGDAVVEFYDNQIAQIENFTQTGATRLEDAFNTMSGQFAEARNAYEEFSEAVKDNDFYTAADNMKKIFNEINNNTDKAGLGSKKFWLGAEELLGAENIEGLNKEAVAKQLDTIEPLLQEGEDGFQAFWDLIDQHKDKLNGLDGVTVGEDGWLQEWPDDLSAISKELGISEKLLASLLDKSRQFAHIDLSDPTKVREALATSDTTIAGLTGDKKNLYVKEDSLRANLRASDYTTKEEQDHEIQRMQNEEQIITIGNPEDLSDKQVAAMKKDLSLGDLPGLIETFGKTGEYTKEEIQGLAERFGLFENQDAFETAYNDWVEKSTDPTQYKQTDLLGQLNSNVASIAAAVVSKRIQEGHLDKPTAEQSEYATYGQKGVADTLGQLFSKGKDGNGEYFQSDASFERNKKALEEQRDSYQEYLNVLREGQQNATGAEKEKFDAEIKSYEKMIGYLNQWLEEGEQKYQERKQKEGQGEDSSDKPTDKDSDSPKSKDDKTETVYDEERLRKQQEFWNKIDNTVFGLLDKIFNPESIKQKQPETTIDDKTSSDFSIGTPTEDPKEIARQAAQEKIAAWIQGLKEGTTNPIEDPKIAARENAKQQWTNLWTSVKNAFINGDGVSDPKVEASEKARQQWSDIWTSVKNAFVNNEGVADPKIEAGEKAKQIWKDIWDRVKKAFSSDPKVDIDPKTNEKGKTNNKETTETTGDLNIFYTGKVANPDEVKASLEQQIASLLNTIASQQSKLSATAKVNVKQGTIEKPKAQKATVNYTKGNQAKADNQTATVNYLLGKQAAPQPKSTTVNYTLGSQAAPKAKTVDISPHFVGSWEKTITLKPAAHGINNTINPRTFPTFGSAAKGARYGKIGPKGKGGLTLTGEEGFEIAWLPSENRSMVLGANGPQMLNLPPDAVVWTHEQSKQILKQKAIPAGSHRGKSTSPAVQRYGGTGNSSTSNKNKKDKDKNKKKKNNDNTDKKVKKLFEKVNVWWDNFTRRTEAHQRNMDKAYKAFEKTLKGLNGTAKNAKEALATYQNALINSTQEQWKGYNKAVQQLKNLDAGGNDDARAIISYSKTTTKKGKKGKKKTTTTSKQENVDLGKYIDYNAALNTYEINQAALDNIDNLEQRKAIADAANQRLNDLLSKRNNAEDAIQKAREELDKVADTMYETFYAWEKSITEIYLLSKRLEVLSGFKNFRSDLIDLETAMLRVGIQTSEIGKNNILQYLTKQQADLTNQINVANQLITAREKDYQDALNADTYFEKLQKSIDSGVVSEDAIADYQAAEIALGIFKEVNGDMSEAIKKAAEFNDGEHNKDFNDKVQKVLDDIFQKQNDAIEASSEAVKLSGEVLSKIEDYNDFIIDFQNDMLEGTKKQAEAEIDQLDKLNDSLTKALKNLLDEVKRKLDERRRIEDNQKTELEISQKQQRLAMLRADTSGGHQVEIAQLEKEIADSQQNYQRTLEDQLLDRLQEQADKAEQQRQQQIDLLKAETDIAAATGVTMKQIEEWLTKGDKESKNALQEAYRSAQGYYDENTSEKERERIDNSFEEAYAKYGAYIQALPKWKEMSKNADLTSNVSTHAQSTVDKLPDAEVKEKSEEADKAIEEARVKKEESLSNSGGGSTVSSTPAAAPTYGWKDVVNTVRGFVPKTGSGPALGANAQNEAAAHKGPKKLKLSNNWDAAVSNYGNVLWHDGTGTVRRYHPDSGLVEIVAYSKSAYKNNAKKSNVGEEFKEALHKRGVKGYKTGGLANYTGPAWLDGTPSKPELVLNARDTENFIALKDVLSKAVNSTGSIDNSYTGDNIFEININVDKIEKDYDVDRVAERVKKKILDSSSYRNVTQVRNFR